MTIICGTDFSEPSENACRIAAELAVHHKEPLLIVHALIPVPFPPLAAVPITPTIYDDMTASARSALRELAGRLSDTGAEIRTVTEIGDPDDVLLQYANGADVRLVVVSSVGRRSASWLLGSTSDRLASRSPVPVLLTRGGFPAREWLKLGEPLRVVVASDTGPGSSAAMQWAAHLSDHGPCRFTVAHLALPAGDDSRYAADSPMHLDHTHPLIEELLRQDLAVAATALHGVGETRIVVAPNLGRTADSLAQLAAREEADLLVVGRGNDEDRHWWEASTSRAVIRRASMSVVCVPDAADAATLEVPRVRRIIAATDLSRRGHAAVAYALGLAAAEGVVRVVHVMDVNSSVLEEARREQIEGLIRMAGPSREGSVDIEVIAGSDPARRITDAAERFEADLICLGTHGRSGLAKMLFGSVSQEVLLRSDRPVLLVPVPRRHGAA